IEEKAPERQPSKRIDRRHGQQAYARYDGRGGEKPPPCQQQETADEIELLLVAERPGGRQEEVLGRAEHVRPPGFRQRHVPEPLTKRKRSRWVLGDRVNVVAKDRGPESPGGHLDTANREQQTDPVRRKDAPQPPPEILKYIALAP